MLPLKDQQLIDINIEHFAKGKSARCSISKCDDSVVNIYQTIEKRSLPMCKMHYEMIAAKTLW